MSPRRQRYAPYIRRVVDGPFDGTDESDDSDVLALQLGNVVRRLRQAENLTLEDLADRAEIHRTHLGLVERGERRLGVGTAAKLASALGLRLSGLIAEAERELQVGDVLLDLSPALEVIEVPARRLADPRHLENVDFVQEQTGLTGEWIAQGIESAYSIVDVVDAKLREENAVPLSQLVELANFSSMFGNLLGAGLANASNGAYKRNKPHTYPDLLPLTSVPPMEIKMALEANSPKGHLPKAGLHITFRYVLGDQIGGFTHENRGDTAWVWEVRMGVLTLDDFSISNTAGDSGKTAVIKTDSLSAMTRVWFNPDHLPYKTRHGRWGHPPPETTDQMRVVIRGEDVGMRDVTTSDKRPRE